jgi:hypothetical protein
MLYLNVNKNCCQNITRTSPGVQRFRISAIIVAAILIFGLTACPGVPGNATVTVLEPVSITLTGIQSLYQGRWARIKLQDAGGNRLVQGGVVVQGGGTASFPFLYDAHSGAAFMDEGTFQVFLFIDEVNNPISSVYHIALQDITRGNNNIAFGSFVEILPVTITVTGISPGHGVDRVTLRIPEAGNYVICRWTETPGNNTATLLGVLPGYYDVILDFFVDDDDDETVHDRIVYIARLKNITSGLNQISFTKFNALHPIRIDVTGIPLPYQHSWFGDIALYTPGTNNEVGLGFTDTVGATTTVQLYFYAAHGYHDVVLWFVGFPGIMGEFIARERDITKGTNTIPFSAFTRRSL